MKIHILHVNNKLVCFVKSNYKKIVSSFFFMNLIFGVFLPVSYAGGLTNSIFSPMVSDFTNDFYSAIKKLNTDDFQLEREGLSELTRLGEEGNTAALSRLVLIYSARLYLSDEFLSNDDGKFPDYQKVIYWTEKWGEAGNAQAMVTLAENYMTGVFTEKSINKADYWYSKAYKHISNQLYEIEPGKDKKNALILLGFLEICGYGIEKDREKSLKHLLNAEELGSNLAQQIRNELANMGGEEISNKFCPAFFFDFQRNLNGHHINATKNGLAFQNMENLTGSELD